MNEQSPISGRGPLTGGNRTPVSANSDEMDIAFEFERIFARRMVEQMTKSLFEEDTENGVMSTSSSMYKDHITDVLSSELARQEALGIAEVVRKYRNSRVLASEIPANETPAKKLPGAEMSAREVPDSENETLKVNK